MTTENENVDSETNGFEEATFDATLDMDSVSSSEPSVDVLEGKTSETSKETEIEGLSDFPEIEIEFVSPNVTLTKNMAREVKPDDEKKTYYASAGLNVDMNEFNTIADSLPNLPLRSTVAGNDYVELVQDAAQSLMRGDVFGQSLKREGSDWRQSVDHNGEQLSLSSPRMGNIGSAVTGEAALMQLQGLTGIQRTRYIPLWHSGIWLKVNTPTEAALMALDRETSSQKIELGKNTNGMIFSNDQILFIQPVVDFCLRCVFDTNIPGWTIEQLRSLIRVTDIPTLVQGVASTIFPEGFLYVAPCVRNPTKCNHIFKKLVNVSAMSVTDNSMLSEEQRRHMAATRSKKSTIEAVLKYQEGFNRELPDGIFSRSFDLVRVKSTKTLIKITLSVPSIQDHIVNGDLWISGIQKLLESAFAVKLSERLKSEYMFEQSKMSALQNWSHWVSKITAVVDGDEGEEPQIKEYTDAELINKYLASVSGNDEIYDKIVSEIGKFIDDATVSVVALPKYKCPKCQTPSTERETKNPYLVPQDVVRLFFTLLTQKLTKLLHTRN